MGFDDDWPGLVDADDLLDDDEVGAALGMPVTAESVPRLSFLPSTTTIFRPVGSRNDRVARPDLPRLGRQRRTIAYQAGTTVALGLRRAGRGKEQHLPRLLAAAVHRLPR
jgi:hypothetical protein